MDISSIVAGVVVAVLAFVIIKFIVSPIIKAIAGIIALLLLIYIIQHYFKLDLNKYFGPLAPYLNMFFDWLNNWLNKITALFKLNFK
jgi:hypothetical protein